MILDLGNMIFAQIKIARRATCVMASPPYEYGHHKHKNAN